MKNFILSLLFFSNIIFSYSQGFTKVVSGKIVRIEQLKSKFVSSRNVDIWLPENYSKICRYPVIYMHDGQMLFDSTLTWNHKEWKVDETFSRLIKSNVIKSCIVVGIWNNGSDRISEYLPNKIFNNIDISTRNKFSEKYCKGKGAQGDNYLKFIIEELKPYIDSCFSTLPQQKNTYLMGSSMGGLISMYGLAEYPNVFGGAACLSTAWLSMIEPKSNFPLAIFNYINHYLPAPKTHKIYMDYGTGESDKEYITTQNFIDIICKNKGYDSTNYSLQVFENEKHDEVAWSKRLYIPTQFLLAKPTFQKPVSGKIELIENFASKYVSVRNIEVWLPKGYNDKEKYSVLYMHDGQMLFDASTTWNKQAWDVDDVATALMNGNKIQKFIVVGIWNDSKKRHSDYFPQKPFETLSPDQKNLIIQKLIESGRIERLLQPQSDNYLRFLVQELKPFIDKNYSVYTDRKHTFVAGSSMGGLISMYAICEYPTVFGGAACISTHWPGIFTTENNPIPEAFNSYLKAHLPRLKNSKLYFDYGDKTLDAMYPPLQKVIDITLQHANPKNKYNWQTQFFPGKDHSENAWKERLNIPLEFLLGK